MLGLFPIRVELMTSLVTETDCAYVRFAASLDFSRNSSSSMCVGGPTSNTVTPARSSFPVTSSRRSSGSAAPIWSADRSTIQSRAAAPSATRTRPMPASLNTARIRLKLA